MTFTPLWHAGETHMSSPFIGLVNPHGSTRNHEGEARFSAPRPVAGTIAPPCRFGKTIRKRESGGVAAPRLDGEP
jgi:hypothetical protein